MLSWVTSDLSSPFSIAFKSFPIQFSCRCLSGSIILIVRLFILIARLLGHPHILKKRRCLHLCFYSIHKKRQKSTVTFVVFVLFILNNQ